MKEFVNVNVVYVEISVVKIVNKDSQYVVEQKVKRAANVAHVVKLCNASNVLHVKIVLFVNSRDVNRVILV